MGLITDPSTGLLDGVDYILLAGVTGLHERFGRLYTLVNGNVDKDNMKINSDFPWTGNHTFEAGKIKIKGAGAGIVSLEYENNANDRTHKIPAKSGNDTFAMLSDITVVNGQSVPIGSIVAHYDFNGTVTPDLNYWKYCDGTIINNANSPLNGLTPDDGSNRYLVGFGTEGGGNVDTAVWAVGAVGNANHQVNLLHNHTVSSHSHSSGTLKFRTMQLFAGLLFGWDGAATSSLVQQYSGTGGGAAVGTWQALAGAPFRDFFTDNGTGSTGSASPSTDSQLSNAQTIQPRSIRVRWIMRIV